MTLQQTAESAPSEATSPPPSSEGAPTTEPAAAAAAAAAAEGEAPASADQGTSNVILPDPTESHKKACQLLCLLFGDHHERHVCNVPRKAL